MARPLRLDYAGAVWDLIARGRARGEIFYNDHGRVDFLELLAEVVRRFRWIVYTYMLLDNHFHLVIETPEATLSRGMQWLLGTYANRFNRRHDRVGHLFQGRFKGVLIEKETQLLNVLRYVALNPVRANMVKAPEEYRWSSYRAIAGLEESPAWLATEAVLRSFAPRPETARQLYELFVHDRVDGSLKIWKDLVEGIYLGSAEWRAQIQRKIDAKPRCDEHPKGQRYVARPKMAQIVPAVAQAFGVSVDEVRERRGSGARGVAAWLGCYEGMLTRPGIAARMRINSVCPGPQLIQDLQLTIDPR